MKYFVIADKKTVEGFSLINVGGIAVSDEQSASEAFSKALNDKSVGYILVSKVVMEMIRPSVEGQNAKGTFPCVLELG